MGPATRDTLRKNSFVFAHQATAEKNARQVKAFLTTSNVHWQFGPYKVDKIATLYNAGKKVWLFLLRLWRVLGGKTNDDDDFFKPKKKQSTCLYNNF